MTQEKISGSSVSPYDSAPASGATAAGGCVQRLGRSLSRDEAPHQPPHDPDDPGPASHLTSAGPHDI